MGQAGRPGRGTSLIEGTGRHRRPCEGHPLVVRRPRRFRQEAVVFHGSGVESTAEGSFFPQQAATFAFRHDVYHEAVSERQRDA